MQGWSPEGAPSLAAVGNSTRSLHGPKDACGLWHLGCPWPCWAVRLLCEGDSISFPFLRPVRLSQGPRHCCGLHGACRGCGRLVKSGISGGIACWGLLGPGACFSACERGAIPAGFCRPCRVAQNPFQGPSLSGRKCAPMCLVPSQSKQTGPGP